MAVLHTDPSEDMGDMCVRFLYSTNADLYSHNNMLRHALSILVRRG